MKWVTWEQVAVDRMGCAWLIRRFVDAQAEFLFVPMGQRSLPEGAEPFDIPGARFSHHGGHCTFYALLHAYQLADPVLHRIARIVDEADTVQEVTLEPAAPGLDLLCRGVRRTSPDDHTALERGALLYDALYAQLASEGPPATAVGHALGPGDPHGQDSEASDPDALGRWEWEGGAPRRTRPSRTPIPELDMPAGATF
jgi:hypothetical protein